MADLAVVRHPSLLLGLVWELLSPSNPLQYPLTSKQALRADLVNRDHVLCYKRIPLHRSPCDLYLPNQPLLFSVAPNATYVQNELACLVFLVLSM